MAGPFFLSGGRDAEHGVGAGASSRRECRGCLPPLSTQRIPPGPLLARRRRRQHARQQPLRSSARSRSRPRRSWQVDRRRDRRARGLARPDCGQSQDRCHARRSRRGPTVLEAPGARVRANPVSSTGCISRSGTTPNCCVQADRRHDCRDVSEGTRHHAFAGLHGAVSTRAATIARTAKPRLEGVQTGRRSWQPSPTSTAR